MNLSKDETHRVRQWFDALLDTRIEYLEREDYALARRIYEYVGWRVPNSIRYELAEAKEDEVVIDTRGLKNDAN